MGIFDKRKANRWVDVIGRMGPYLKPMMLEKLNPSDDWRSSHLPEGLDLDTALSQMNEFIETKLDDFIERCVAVLPYFTNEDSASIGTEAPTERAVQFVGLFEYLEGNGFLGAQAFKKPLNFWSGTEAQKAAVGNTEELSDSQVPCISVMYDVCRAIQRVFGHYESYLTLLSSSISKAFATSANEVAHIYISSDKRSESPGFTVTNNFWEGELAALRAGYDSGRISDIQVSLYDHERREWRKSVSLFSEKGRKIPVRRRSSHPLDRAEDRICFKTCSMSESERKAWAESKPRPFITLDRLSDIAHRFREKVEPRGRSLGYA